jgi:hypothetical protein
MAPGKGNCARSCCARPCHIERAAIEVCAARIGVGVNQGQHTTTGLDQFTAAADFAKERCRYRTHPGPCGRAGPVPSQERPRAPTARSESPLLGTGGCSLKIAAGLCPLEIHTSGGGHPPSRKRWRMEIAPRVSRRTMMKIVGAPRARLLSCLEGSPASVRRSCGPRAGLG